VLFLRSTDRSIDIGGAVSTGALMIALLQIVVMIFLTPLLLGVMRQVRNRFEGRVGAGVAQVGSSRAVQFFL
jgi:formate hydrogenlyase subunit 4